MINATQIRVGNILKIENDLFRVLKIHHVTPGKGNAVVQTDLRNIKTGIKTNQRFRSTETVESVDLDVSKVEFLYADGKIYHFMNPENYEQLELDEEILGDSVKLLKPQTPVTVISYENNPIGITLPDRMSFEVKECNPPEKGMAGALKNATLENDLVVKVPLFIKQGDMIVIDTETQSYYEKA